MLNIVSKLQYIEISNFSIYRIERVLRSIPWHLRVFYVDSETKLGSNEYRNLTDYENVFCLSISYRSRVSFNIEHLRICLLLNVQPAYWVSNFFLTPTLTKCCRVPQSTPKIQEQEHRAVESTDTKTAGRCWLSFELMAHQAQQSYFEAYVSSAPRSTAACFRTSQPEGRILAAYVPPRKAQISVCRSSSQPWVGHHKHFSTIEQDIWLRIFFPLYSIQVYRGEGLYPGEFLAKRGTRSSFSVFAFLAFLADELKKHQLVGFTSWMVDTLFLK